jgi:hypothetical protein
MELHTAVALAVPRLCGRQAGRQRAGQGTAAQRWPCAAPASSLRYKQAVLLQQGCSRPAVSAAMQACTLCTCPSTARPVSSHPIPSDPIPHLIIEDVLGDQVTGRPAVYDGAIWPCQCRVRDGVPANGGRCGRAGRQAEGVRSPGQQSQLCMIAVRHGARCAVQCALCCA